VSKRPRPTKILAPVENTAHERSGWIPALVINAIGVVAALWFALHPERLPFTPQAIIDEYSAAISVVAVAAGLVLATQWCRAAAAYASLLGWIPLAVVRVATDGRVLVRFHHKFGLVRQIELEPGSELAIQARASRYPTSHGKRLDLQRASTWTVGSGAQQFDVELAWPFDQGTAKQFGEALAPHDIALTHGAERDVRWN